MRPRQIDLAYINCGHVGLRGMTLVKDTIVLAKTLSLNIDGERI